MMIRSVGWPNRTESNLNDAELKLRTKVCGVAIPKLESLSPSCAASELANGLRAVFVASSQACQVMRYLLEMVEVHERRHYANLENYRIGINAHHSPIWLENASSSKGAVCLTGLAGTGKSSITKAVARLLQSTERVLRLGSPYQDVKLNSVWHADARLSRSVKEILRGPLEQLSYDVPSGKPESRLVEWLSRIAYRHGTGLLLVDEWQFITQSSSANALITRLLHSLSYIGLPFCYVANYSLCRRIMRRPQEDQQRLLANPLILLPDEQGDDSLAELFGEYVRVSNGALEHLLKNHQEALHRYTLGVKRVRIELLALAYRLARESGRHIVSVVDLERAFGSMEFTRFREETQLLYRSMGIGRAPEGRVDLGCPFDLPPKQVAADKLYSAEVLRAAAQSRAALDSLTCSERKVLRAVESSHGNEQSPRTPKRPKRKQPTAEELLQGHLPEDYKD